MRTDPLGIAVYDSNDIIEILHQGKIDVLEDILVEDSKDIDEFNQWAREFGGVELKKYSPLEVSVQEFDTILSNDWYMPEEYKSMDIAKWVLDQCTDQDQLQRVGAELLEFQRRDMMDLLRWMKYFVDTCRSENIVWGVGRGSSVASYVLYKIGVHKIDSMRYNLDWQEFLR
jgi:DNA polymerase III alpha subunit